MTPRRLLLGALLVSWLTGCVNATVDQMVFNSPTEGMGDASVVILGRRHASDYETEPGFISCVGKHIGARDPAIRVIDELEFLNALYPWFEPRTAPLRPADLEKLFAHRDVVEKFATLQTRYMIWIDGSTVRGDSAGSMTCGIGPGGAGCFGFGTWSDDASYEATIWDFTQRAEVGRISATASGQSYMPAVVLPIPIIAPVQGTACDSVGDQLLDFLSTAN
ncbi:MAG: hypothetical protein NXH81_17020 [Halieaceae bacterium]|uniref:hypothetical protein n=1 Tax=Haliea alexandrii TaxID=2448162 RepID=UPI000F0B5C57|nr:hypothetical protein [Haliea alexandrii]MCR9187105.1 hypothetical protein [Halieaceae bacterium]